MFLGQLGGWDNKHQKESKKFGEQNRRNQAVRKFFVKSVER